MTAHHLQHGNTGMPARNIEKKRKLTLNPPLGSPKQEQHEMAAYPAPAGGFLSQQDFLSRVSRVRAEIRSLTTQVQQISTLHQQALAGSDDSVQRRLDDQVAATQQQTNAIRDQIHQLKKDVEDTPANHPSGPMKKKQWETLNADFKRETQGYLQEEQDYSQRYRDQIARQYRIVNPDATEQEVRDAANQDWGNEGVFQTAVRTCLLMSRSSPAVISFDADCSWILPAAKQPRRPSIRRAWKRARAASRTAANRKVD